MACRRVQRDPLPLAGHRSGDAAGLPAGHATSEDGEIMGVRHRDLAGTATPLEGVQFHPESILSEHGHAMLRNFLEMSSPR
jgi:anthranilate/para-aminobenzoate synthase component II